MQFPIILRICKPSKMPHLIQPLRTTGWEWCWKKIPRLSVFLVFHCPYEKGVGVEGRNKLESSYSHRWYSPCSWQEWKQSTKPLNKHQTYPTILQASLPEKFTCTSGDYFILSSRLERNYITYLLSECAQTAEKWAVIQNCKSLLTVLGNVLDSPTYQGENDAICWLW